MIHEERIEVANKALASFDAKCLPQIEILNNRLCVSWLHYSTGKRLKAMQWVIPNGRTYPTIASHKMPWGGTQTNAISALVRWIKGLPVHGIVPQWRYWAGTTVKLCELETVAILEAGGYPPVSICVICGKEGGGDWWSDDDKSGPCCSFGRCETEEQRNKRLGAYARR